MNGALEFMLNGRTIRLEQCSPNTTLLEYLRGNGLTGSKEGCAEGDCGACSVAILSGDVEGRACYRAINSCLVPVCLLAGREIVTVEGCQSKVQSLKSKVRSPGSEAEVLHPVQEKMVACHGSQCGYCTPGFILSMFEGYYRTDIRMPDQLDDQLSGNLCRCTGYRPIREAAIEAFQESYSKNGNDAFAARLKLPIASLGEVGYQADGEQFFRPTSLTGLLEVVAKYPEGRLIAGATELGLDITKRYKKFPTLISTEAVPELRTIESTDTEWRIGAAATLTEIEEKMAKAFPALGRMLRVFGSRQIRNRATMGGNIVTASPIGDSAPVLLALDAQVVLVSPQNGAGAADALVRRQIPISEFFVAYRKTALQPGEILQTIIVPRHSVHGPEPGSAGILPAGSQRRREVPQVVDVHHGEPRRLCEWYKVSKRREMDISTVAACFVVDLDGDNVVRHARLAYGGVAAVPSRALKTVEALLGKPWVPSTIDEALPILRSEFQPISDVRGSAEYRLGLITSLLEKFYFESTSGGQVGTIALKGLLTPALSPSEWKRGNGGRSNKQLDAMPKSPQAARTGKRPLPHESGHLHVTGEALYTDDMPREAGMLEVWPVCAPHAHAKILRRDVSAVRTMPGIRAVLLAEDIPGLNDVGTRHDEPLFPDKEVSYHGQVVALLVGESLEACRAAAAKVEIQYEPLTPILTIKQALAASSFHNEPNFIRRGKADEALARSPFKIAGTFDLGGQEHFYLETQAARAVPAKDSSMFVTSSTQHPSEVQAVIAHVLNVSANKVVVQCPRMGGGFGGKETQAAFPAALAALAARVTGRSVRVRFDRDQDMILTGHRHPFLARFEAGFDRNGAILAARIHLWSNGGWAADLSQAVTDRALFHLDNAYYLPAVEFRGQVAKTHLSSNTAFRGFGGPQGMLVIEEIMDRIARHLGLQPELVRERNLYHGKGAANTTHYGQKIADNRIQTIWHQLKKSSGFARRRKEVTAWNAAHPHCKRGLAITPVKFGISFTVTHLNQAGAFVLIYQDGTAQVNHGGTEMGQGVHTNIAMIAARELGLKPESVRVMPTSTDKVPNTSATAASCGTDLNGAAVHEACQILRARLMPVAAQLLKEKLRGKVPLEDLDFFNGMVRSRRRPKQTIPFVDVVRKAYQRRISLSATGYYATPGIVWDRAAGRGTPFHYFAYGAAVSEVEVDGFTGMMRVLRADILHDVGDSINAGINRGQIEGGFVQGMGWLTTEELKWDDQGRLLTHSPDTYKLPSVGDMPQVFNVTFLKNAAQPGVVFGSKAVGEPPLMLAISVREAIRDAVAAFGPPGGEVRLSSPATCEVIYMAVRSRTSQTRQTGRTGQPASLIPATP